METKPLLYGLIGFFLGGLIVSVAATFDMPHEENSEMSMIQMTENLKNKRGDEFDQAFITNMIEHHKGAVEMSRLSAKNAKHEKIKSLSSDIIDAQEKEINEMKRWQMEWGYHPMNMSH